MQSRAFLSCVALSGCGFVSGLDTLHVDDAGDDVTADDASDGGVADAAIGADVVVDGYGVHCGPQTCTGGLVCCFNPSTPNSTYTCAKDGCTSGSSTLKCDDKSDCTGSQNCCFTAGSSQCGLSGTSNCIALCADSTQCAGGSTCVAFDAGDGLPLKRCQ